MPCKSWKGQSPSKRRTVRSEAPGAAVAASAPLANARFRPVSVTRECPLHACSLLVLVRQSHRSQPCAVTWIPCVPRERGIALDPCYHYVYVFLSPCTLKPP